MIINGKRDRQREGEREKEMRERKRVTESRRERANTSVSVSVTVIQTCKLVNTEYVHPTCLRSLSTYMDSRAGHLSV